MSRSLEGFNKLFEKIVKLTYVNILWILFSLLGLIIFGFFPATIAMFGVARKWIMGDNDINIFKTFWNYYKKDFMKSNILGFLLLLISYIMYLNFIILEEVNNGILQLFYYPLFTINVVFFLMLLYVFPTFVHYNLNVYQVIKNACIIMFMNPLITIIKIIGTLIICYTMVTIPVLIPFVGGSILSYFVMYTSFNAFSTIEKPNFIKVGGS